MTALKLERMSEMHNLGGNFVPEYALTCPIIIFVLIIRVTILYKCILKSVPETEKSYAMVIKENEYVILGDTLS